MFGFNRLSIIDVEHSHQPLRWGPPGADDRYAIVFNGEVYNYLELRAELAELGATFATEGDTEAVVAAYHHWGPAAVSRLRGMFAFAIWDTHERVLFAARDPFGIKPLFVAEGPGGIAFASEKKSLLELAPALGLGHVDRDLDAAALQHYLLLQYVPEPATLHRAIRRVESGTHVTVRPGGSKRQARSTRIGAVAAISSQASVRPSGASSTLTHVVVRTPGGSTRVWRRAIAPPGVR